MDAPPPTLCEKEFSGWFERWEHIILGIAAGMLVWMIFRDFPVPKQIPALAAALTTAGSIFVGFLATAKSILASLTGHPFIERLKKHTSTGTSYYLDLIDYLMTAIRWSLFLTIYACVTLLIDFDLRQSWHEPFVIGLAILFTVALVSFYRVVSVFTLVLKKA